MEQPIIIRSLGDAKRAFEESSGSIILMSVPNAAASLGVVGFLEMVTAAASEYAGREFTAILDCGDQAGLAMNALRLGAKDISVDLPQDVRAKIEDIAKQCGASLHHRPNS